MGLSYLVAVVVSMLCMGLVDRRWRLFLFAGRPGRALALVGAGAALFLGWDLAAIEAGIYERGGSPAMTGLEVLPELPLEEIFFVVFFCYLTMVLHRLLLRVLAPAPRVAARVREESAR
ncbi:lycopene cyclase domain-containing protein [Mumia sp. zg.B53]|uniref:lycopene cyclase domain-containing protein n=1 Tax=unclassified Mumia TaxID=2621872 RepID=UPI001C6F5402|nr:MULTISPECIES: lycopene cyclase domain-containing protein [unclassified Mumia]MBW9205837.1 lycopene cyclase domain-containing protein [Mumia sp. zg.B17]MBW9208159.1 lycopene cyclase domain-containing protein [Mumia sp. zg.B21]MBW9216114.1 lycopene cyclase domain-containing protein [Mumia sp. zg.B53]MDD9348225.1 lycopene cyclase domain-containing protein [Mumia sp.]